MSSTSGLKNSLIPTSSKTIVLVRGTAGGLQNAVGDFAHRAELAPFAGLHQQIRLGEDLGKPLGGQCLDDRTDAGREIGHAELKGIERV